MKAISFRDVYFSIKGRPILEGVNLEIEDRGFYAIIGPNGGGKTTLLKLALGLYAPDRGEVKVFGTDPHLHRSRIGFMPQYLFFDSRFPVSVLDVVLMGTIGGRRKFGPFSRSDKGRALSALEALGALELAHRPFFALSGGERQRVLIARALVCNPLILLLDEPSANVDMAFEQTLGKFLFELSRKIAVCIVTHDLGFVSEHVDVCICVNRVVSIHPLEELTGDLIRNLYGRDLKLVKHGLSGGC